MFDYQSGLRMPSAVVQFENGRGLFQRADEFSIKVGLLQNVDFVIGHQGFKDHRVVFVKFVAVFDAILAEPEILVY